jgi:hypothetical protein
VPEAVVTVTSTTPAAFAGAVTVMELSALTTKSVMETLPKFTLVVPVKALPVIVIWVPPVVGPALTSRPVTVDVAAEV